jgi:Antibiotic biosynthesis monooxygenase
MVKIVEMDEKVTIKTQLEEYVGSVILVNKFTINPHDVDEFLKVFSTTSQFFKQQPGFISAQLHRGIADSSTFFNYVVWESAEHLNEPSIDLNSSQEWLMFFPMLLCLLIYLRKLQCQESVWIDIIWSSVILRLCRFSTALIALF